MLFQQLGAAAALASVSSAFLLPPTISEADTDTINALPFEDAVAMDVRMVGLDCPGCPIVTDLNEKLDSQSDSMLLMNFTIQHNENEADQLLLNSMPLYPIDILKTMTSDAMTADQLVSEPNEFWVHTGNPTVGYSMSVQHLADSAQDGVSVTTLHVNIIEVADQFMSGIPSMEIKLLETPSGKMMIGDAEIMAPEAQAVAGQECTTLLCRWEAVIAAKISAMKQGLKKGCGSKAPHKEQAAGEAKPHHGHGQMGHKPHSGSHENPRLGGHHRGHRHHRPSAVALFFRGLVMHVFIPLVIGIMVGIFASLVGMIVGHLAIFMWRLVFRRGSSKYTKVEQVEEAGEAKFDGAPPQYEEAVDEKA